MPAWKRSLATENSSIWPRQTQNKICSCTQVQLIQDIFWLFLSQKSREKIQGAAAKIPKLLYHSSSQGASSRNSGWDLPHCKFETHCIPLSILFASKLMISISHKPPAQLLKCRLWALISEWSRENLRAVVCGNSWVWSWHQWDFRTLSAGPSQCLSPMEHPPPLPECFPVSYQRQSGFDWLKQKNSGKRRLYSL